MHFELEDLRTLEGDQLEFETTHNRYQTRVLNVLE